MAIKSNTLFHFTPKADYLINILKNGFWPRYCLEDVSWLFQSTNYPKYAYPMVCFCDIPLQRISEHTDFYGKFGIGLTKKWALQNNLNPIWYVSEQSNPVLFFSAHLYLLHQLYQDPSKLETNIGLISDNELKNLIHEFIRCSNTLSLEQLSHIKPIKGSMTTSKGMKYKNFDEESEWRYLLSTKDIDEYIKYILDADDYENNKDEYNKKTENHMLKFQPSDIKYIFVPKEDDIPGTIKEIQKIYAHHPQDEILLLISKVISLETISKDL